MRLENKLISRCRPCEERKYIHISLDTQQELLAILLTSNLSKFCSCSGLSRRSVVMKDSTCVRTYGRGSSEYVCEQ